MVSPSELLEKGVRVCRTDQEAGQFVVTFPRAYHAGFNNGINFAEAVNFTCWDWLEYGFRSVSNYQNVCRVPVFSHEEFICAIALKCNEKPNEVDCRSASIISRQLQQLFNEQSLLSHALQEAGMVNLEQKNMENLTDDDRQCPICKITCYLFATRCECKPELFSCLLHTTQFCKCPLLRKTIVYRFDDLQIAALIDVLEDRASVFQVWKSQLLAMMDRKKEILEARANSSLSPEFLVPINEIIVLKDRMEKDWVTDAVIRSNISALNEAIELNHKSNEILAKSLKNFDEVPVNTIYNLMNVHWVHFAATEPLRLLIEGYRTLIKQCNDLIEKFLSLEMQSSRDALVSLQAVCQQLLQQVTTSKSRLASFVRLKEISSVLDWMIKGLELVSSPDLGQLDQHLQGYDRLCQDARKKASDIVQSLKRRQLYLKGLTQQIPPLKTFDRTPQVAENLKVSFCCGYQLTYTKLSGKSLINLKFYGMSAYISF
jgi:hypothetical protein